MTVNEKGLKAAMKAFAPDLFGDDPQAAHRDASPLQIEAAQQAQINRVTRAIEAYLRAASKDAEPVEYQYRYWYSSGEPGVWLSERRKDADDLLESGVLIREETRALFTFQPDALVHVDGVTMTPTAAANRIAELSAAQADHSTAIEPVAASPGVPDGYRLAQMSQDHEKKAEETGWRYNINYGPDGEKDWANLITPEGEHVANIRTRHAIRIVSALSTSSPVGYRLVPVEPTPAGGDEVLCDDFVADPCGSARCHNCGKRRAEHRLRVLPSKQRSDKE